MAEIPRRDFLVAVLGSVVAVPMAAGAAQAEAMTRRAAPSRRFFSFLHTYEATGRCWRGLEKAGLLRPTTGVRLVNSPWGDDARRFNSVARIGGELHAILKQRRCPLIVDRVVGGSTYRAYEFDRKLIRAYASLLGDRFLGGQVHETISNVHNDWTRIVKANPRFRHEPIRAEELGDYFNERTPERSLEYGTLADYAGRRHPANAGEFWREIERAFRRQAARFGSWVSYCEGSHRGELVWPAFYKLGARYCLAEVGPWASQQTQFAIASLRGAARAAGRPWGVFFAPWGPAGCTAFVPEQDWSWQCSREFFAGFDARVDAASGPSTALQRRSFFHSYLSGAWTLHEEWGAESNLTDWERGALSCNGRVTRDFVNFQEQHPDVGEPYTPLALVLDPQMPPRDAETWVKLKAALFEPDATGRAHAARGTSHSQEIACYAPCVVPEVFDLVPADAPRRVWKNYKAVMEVAARGSSFDRIVTAAKALSPFELSARLPLQINYRRRDGTWILGLYNPWGAKRGDVENLGSVLDEGCAVRAVLRPKFALRSIRVLHGWPESTTAHQQGDEIEVVVGPGGTLVLVVTPVSRRHLRLHVEA